METIKKDLTTVESGIVAHGCNCSGGFGSGIAGAIKNRWPAVAIEFRGNGTGAQLLGTIQPVQLAKDLIVVNCYTQEFYGPGDKRYANPEAIKHCLEQVLDLAESENVDLYVAKIGCGLGGLSWEHEVIDIYDEVFSVAQVNVYVCDI